MTPGKPFADADADADADKRGPKPRPKPSDPAEPAEPEQDVTVPGTSPVRTLHGVLADEISEAPEGWLVRWRVTGKDRLSDRWTEITVDTREEAVAWAAARAFLLPRPDGVQVRCALVQAAGI